MNLVNYQFLKKLEALNFIEKIYLFGSRARGDHKERSDIDLAIVCPKASEKDWQKAMDIIEDADTLLKIDCLRLDEKTSPNLKEAILKEGIVLYERQQAAFNEE